MCQSQLIKQQFQIHQYLRIFFHVSVKFEIYSRCHSIVQRLRIDNHCAKTKYVEHLQF